MVAKAFVFINVHTGSETQVLEKLREVPEIKESYFVYGVYDLIVKVETESLDHLKEVITWKIRRLDNVVSTITSMVMEEK